MGVLAVDRIERINELACTHLELDPDEITDTALFMRTTAPTRSASSISRLPSKMSSRLSSSRRTFLS